MRRARVLLAIVAASAVACARDEPAPSERASTDRTGATAAPSASSAEDSLDLWSKGEVIRRLAEAGLVVADSGGADPFPPLTRAGDRLEVSGSELRVYVFPDAAARAIASAALDTTPPATGYATEWRTRPRVILVNNLIALHFTPSDRLAERVDNVLRARHLGP